MSTSRVRMAGASLVLALGLSGCSDATVLPAAATPPGAFVSPPLTALPTGSTVLAAATLSGTVYEVVADSPRQIAGIAHASVYCEQCGESTHNFAFTDSNGSYIFPPGVWTEGRPEFPVRISVSKDGYRDPAGLPRTTPPNPSGPGWREVVVHGDTQFDMELVRR